MSENDLALRLQDVVGASGGREMGVLGTGRV